MKALNFLAKLVSTFFCVGYLPLIPGTFGSFAGLAVFYLIRANLSLYLWLILIITLVGFLFSGIAEKTFKRKDPGCIVIDEVSGMLLSLLFLPYDLRIVIAGFFLFRILDTLKPYPAGRLQKIRGGVGIMIDDLIAAIYTNLILQVVVRLI